MRTRKVDLLGRVCEPTVLKSFLGFELKLKTKRITCPDMVTLRYLRLFAEIGMKQISIPYNPVDTQRILPFLENAFQEIKRDLERSAADPPTFKRRRREVFRRLRKQLGSIPGSGDIS